MSFICGIIGTAETASERTSDPDRLLAEHSRIGGHTPTAWQDTFSCLAHQETVSVPGTTPRRVIHDAESGLTITADARLDNRQELLDIFDLQGFPRQRTCTGELILRAFQKWGADCPQHLLGDFAFAIWDQRKQQLFAARDAFGVRPLYYHAGREQLIFASDLKAVLAAAGVPKEPDTGCFATILGWDNPHDTDLSRTAWAAVRRLPPGHTLTLVNGHVTTSAWWKPEDIAAVRFRRVDDYAACLRQLLTTAVHDRLPDSGAVGTHLSGGLDASSVVALTAPLLQQRQQTLHSYFWGPPVAGGGFLPAEERPFVSRICQHLKIDCHYVAPTVADAGRWRIRSSGDRPHGVSYREYAVRRLAAAQNVQVMLSGLGGDAGVSRQLVTNVPWIFRPSFGGFQASDVRELGKHYLHRLPRSLWHKWVKHNFSKRRQGRAHQRERQTGSLPFLTTAGLACVKEIAGQESRNHVTHDSLSQAAITGRAEYRRLARLEAWAIDGPADGMEYRYPLLDRRVVEFALGVPQELWQQQGRNHFLFRQAVADALPSNLARQLCTREVAVNRDRRRINDAFADHALWAAIEPCLGADCTVLNTDALRTALSSNSQKGADWGGPLGAVKLEMMLNPAFEEAVLQQVRQLGSCPADFGKVAGKAA